MRDILVLAVIVGSLPFCFLRPHTGILMWVWVGLMNPHQLAWSTAPTFPVAQVVAIATLAGIPFAPDRKKFPWVWESSLLLSLLLLFFLTTCLALNQRDAWAELSRVAKIYLMTLATLFFFQSRLRLRLLMLIIALSIAFFGVKGAIYSVFISGGEHRIFGPPNSFIADNNALALAELMILPLLYYLGFEMVSKWSRGALHLCAMLTLVSVIFSYSRGALLALLALLLFWLVYSKRKWIVILGLTVLVFAAIPLIPGQWYRRMETIKDYQEDASAMGRVNAWWFAYNLAKERPLIGGGFKTFVPPLFQIYAPDPNSVHDSHSIYFEVLGEHGFPGLLLFLLLLYSCFSSLHRINRLARSRSGSLQWTQNYCSMLSLGLVSYLVGGALLGLAYFDLYYYLVAAVIMLKVIVNNQIREESDPISGADHAVQVATPECATRERLDL